MNRVVVLIALLYLVSPTYAQTGEFTYQGRLVAGGSAANSRHDFEFRLCDSELDCTMPLAVRERVGVAVSNGVFTVKLDFNPAHFNGADRWLEIAVRPAGGTSLTTLTPRQRITSAPYSIKSFNAEDSARLGGVSASQYVITTDPRMTDARDPLPNSPSYIQNNPSSSQLSSSFNIGGNGSVGGTLNASVVSAGRFDINGVRTLVMEGDTSNLYGGFSGGTPSSGALNTFFGMGTGLTSTGTRNTFFGSLVGTNNVDGSFNSFFGLGAGENNISGSENTMVGFRAQPAAGDLSNATAIGANSHVSQSNSFVLGSIAGVNGATASTNVGIGTTAPAERLHVNGNGLFTGNLVFRTPWFPGISSGLSTEDNNTLINFGINTGRQGPFDNTRPGYWIRTDTRIGSQGFHFFKKASPSETETQLMTLTDSGRLGIGTPAPTAALDVNGNIKFSGTITGNGSALTNLDIPFLMTHVTVFFAVPPGPNNVEGTAACPVGTSIVAGGFEIPDAVGPNFNVMASRPGGSGWSVRVRNAGGSSFNALVYALCAQLNL